MRLPQLVAMGMIFLSTGCLEDNAPSKSNRATEEVSLLEDQVISSIAENVILRTYKDLRDQTKQLAELAMKLKQNPTSENLTEIQKKWKEARVPWESTEGFLFGPVDSLGVDPAIDSWPLSKIDLDLILSSRPNIDVNFVRQLGTDVQGFHTAEYLLFGAGVNSNTKTISEMTEAELNYLAAVTVVLSEQTEKLFHAWTVRHDPTDKTAKPFIEIVSKPGLDNPFYPSKKAVFQEFVQGMIKIAVEVGKGKISDPLGGDVASADPSLVESQFSWNSLTDFQNNIMSLRNVYLGGYRQAGLGLSEIVKSKNPSLDKRIQFEIDAAEQAIAAIAGPEGWSFTLAIKQELGRSRAEKAIAALQRLETTLQSDLLPLFQ